MTDTIVAQEPLFVDHHDRPLVPDETLKRIDSAFSAVPDGKRGALLIIVTEKGANAHFAAKLGEHWKVAAGAGKPWDGPVHAEVGIAASW